MAKFDVDKILRGNKKFEREIETKNPDDLAWEYGSPMERKILEQARRKKNAGSGVGFVFGRR